MTKVYTKQLHHSQNILRLHTHTNNTMMQRNLSRPKKITHAKKLENAHSASDTTKATKLRCVAQHNPALNSPHKSKGGRSRSAHGARNHINCRSGAAWMRVDLTFHCARAQASRGNYRKMPPSNDTFIFAKPPHHPSTHNATAAAAALVIRNTTRSSCRPWLTSLAIVCSEPTALQAGSNVINADVV